jgi:hypothetical protein
MSKDFPDNRPSGMPWQERSYNAATAPSSEELNHLRRDASEGDPDAAAFFRNRETADEALERWRNAQKN